MEKNENKTSHRLVSENTENGNPKTTTVVSKHSGRDSTRIFVWSCYHRYSHTGRLKPEFDNFPLIVKSVSVSREDIGEYMAKIAEEHEFLKKPKRALISSHFGVKVLVNTDMSKYYLEKGLKG